MNMWRLFLAGALFLTASAASSQDSQIKGGPAGQFDFYVLALSWSPGFCALEGDILQKSQCATGTKLSFVTHGLWPQNEKGYPVFCQPGGRYPSRAAIEAAKTLYPDDNLLRYQWRKHGTCSGDDPTTYFGLVQKARDKIKIPDSLTTVLATTNAMPVEIERLFIQANPGLRRDMMAVSCRRGIFQEVRICLTRDLRDFRSCQEVDRNSCRAIQISVPAMR